MCEHMYSCILTFTHTSSICMHVCHVHMMCVWVMCYVFNYIQQSPKWSLTTTLYLSHTLSTCGPSSPSIPIPLPCPSNGMLPSNPTMSSPPTPCTIESPALSPSQRCGTSFDGRGLATFSGHMFLCGFINQATVQFHTYNPKRHSLLPDQQCND